MVFQILLLHAQNLAVARCFHCILENYNLKILINDNCFSYFKVEKKLIKKI